jgi:hypothetical protein
MAYIIVVQPAVLSTDFSGRAALGTSTIVTYIESAAGVDRQCIAHRMG